MLLSLRREEEREGRKGGREEGEEREGKKGEKGGREGEGKWREGWEKRDTHTLKIQCHLNSLLN